MIGMRRREFITLVGGVAAVWPLGAQAQPTTNIRLIGFLGMETEAGSAPWVDGLRAGLRDLGYFEGKDIVFEFRYADGKYERLAQLAAELLERKIDVLVTTERLGGAQLKMQRRPFRSSTPAAVTLLPQVLLRASRARAGILLGLLSSTRSSLQNGLSF